MGPVEKDGDPRGLLVARLDERAPVEFRDSDRELERRREPRELPEPEPRVRGRVRVDAAEKLGRGDVVVDEDLPRVQLHQLVDDLVAHREMHDEHVVRLDVTEQAPIGPDVGDTRLGFDRVRIRLVAPAADAPAQSEDVVAHRVAGREGRMELMDRAHVTGARPTTA